MTAENNTVVFYVDGKQFCCTTAQYYPREMMTLNFNEWFADPTASGQSRSWDEKVNWVYYNSSAALTPDQVNSSVSGYYGSGTDFVDTVPTPVAQHDYNGDGTSDASLFYDYGPATAAGCALGSEHTAMLDLAGHPDNSGLLGGLAQQWDGACQPAKPKFVVSGDFNGDGKSDVAALYDYGPNITCTGGSSDHVAIVEWPADPHGTGTLQVPQTVWDSPCWGGGTSFMTAGDFNGDDKSDLALLYDYGAGHVRLFTLTADASGDGGFGGVVSQWDDTTWGTGTKFMTTGDFNGDGKSDLALFVDYGHVGAATGCTVTDAHQAVFTLTADPYGSGTLQAPTKAWESTCFGGGTIAMT